MKEEQNELCYPVKTVKFKTCVELYKKWKVTKLRYKTASAGVDVEVEYADTLELIDPDKESNYDFKNYQINEYNELENIKCFPLNDEEYSSRQNYKPLTALMLHGAPGCHRDYQHLIKYFIKRNVRVIAPKFPNYRLTKKTPFCHSPAEKAEYIKDFLDVIGVNRVDLLLCHSSGLFVAARLITDSLNAFNIQTEIVKCKKCKKDKKCSKCEKLDKPLDKTIDSSDSTTTDDEENEELYKKFDQKLNDLERLNEEDEEKLIKKTDSKKNDSANKKTQAKKPVKDAEKEEENKVKEEKEKPDEKQEQKQLNSLNDDEGYQDAIIDEQVKGQQKAARKLFSTTTIQKSKIYFGSLILINCVSHKRSKLLNPILKNSLYEPSAFFYQLKISRSVVRFCGKIYLDIFGSPVDYNNFDNTILTLTTVLRSSVKSLKHQLERITKTNLPILMFFSESDRLITKGQSYELANFLNVNYIQRDFSDASHHNYDVFNYNAKKKEVKVEENNNEILPETQIELQSTTSSDEYDSLRHNESEIESDTSSTKNSSSNEEGSFKSMKSSDSELRTEKSKTDSPSSNDPLILNQVKYPYAVSIKKGRHYSHITHSHVMDEHIGKLISILNLRKD